MKKTLLKAFGVLALAATMVMASCSTDASNISSQIDTVLTLSAPEVKVTAYPGMNYVSWKPVANANGYVVYIYEDGHFVETVSKSYTDLEHEDNWRLKNGAEYTYYVEATSKTSSGRSVVTENSLSKPVSVNAIVPDYNVKALDLNNHEKGIGKKGNDKFVVAADNIHIARDSYDKLSVSFPSKAYLAYNVYWTIDNELGSVNGKRAILDTSSNVKYYGDAATNDKILVTGEDTVITTSGTYKFGVLAFAKNDHFGTSDIVWATETIEIENLVGDFAAGSAITKAAYKDLGKTVRVTFPKFVLNDGTTAPASYYKVYRSPKDAPYNYTPVSGTVKATDSTNSVFYVDDAIEDNTIAYLYTLVVTDGKKFAGNAPDPEKVDVYTPAQATALVTAVSGTPSTQETDAIANDITWTFKLADNTKVKGVYTLERPATEAYNSGTYQVVAADFDTADEKNLISSVKSTTNTDGVSYTVYTKNHTVGTKVYMLVVIEEENKAVREVISAAVEIKAPVVDGSSLRLSVNKYDNTVTGATTTTPKIDDVVINVTDIIDTETDSFANYTYKLYRTTASVEEKMDTSSAPPTPYLEWKYDADDWTEVTGFAMKKVADDNILDGRYFGFVEQANFEDGIYAYKVVKSNAISSVSKIDWVTINANKKTIGFEPGEDGMKAYFVNPGNAESDVRIEFYKTGTGSATPATLTANEEVFPDSYTYPVSYNPITEEDGVTYVLYRARLAAGGEFLKLEFKKVTQADGTTVKGFGKTENKVTETVFTWNTSLNNYESHNEDYCDKITYSLNDTGLSTGDSYMYIIVATKAGADPVIVANPTYLLVHGSN